MNGLRKVLRVVDIVVFVCATLAIAGVFCEGMAKKWYDFVGVFVFCSDYSFLIATVLHVIADRKEKIAFVHYFSLTILIVGLIMKVAGIPYHPLVLTIWFQYIWFLYGIILARRYFGKKISM
ncbi:hypothetical protein [Butyrivibrio sp. INlla21]|uniref:hypothetical protein n=1 Tax=Butyrivibrio sp. INlla21 TaxID=1520811 RepID=UPI0008E1B7E8|nr:hypothetical protein [Butyrivibrio sp. INlla21]SFU60526.1 hypothetical protein SAMN02910342_01106 [Butyrivibrio sp. INlla21]